MNCTKCGKPLKPNASFCSGCGTKTADMSIKQPDPAQDAPLPPAGIASADSSTRESGNALPKEGIAASTDNQNLDLEQIMEQRIRDNFAAPANAKSTISDERLIEMNKKLPSWSLEPPYSFLK